MQAIERERELLADLRERSHRIDTSQLRPAQLLDYVKTLIAAPSAQLTLVFESFAFKRGITLDADYVFDVRMLPNPTTTRLRALTGRDAPVTAFLEQQAEVTLMFEQIAHFLQTWLPAMARDHRSYVTVAIGCTGGSTARSISSSAWRRISATGGWRSSATASWTRADTRPGQDPAYRRRKAQLRPLRLGEPGARLAPCGGGVHGHRQHVQVQLAVRQHVGEGWVLHHLSARGLGQARQGLRAGLERRQAVQAGPDAARRPTLQPDAPRPSTACTSHKGTTGRGAALRVLTG
jgi:hypothetical protein